MACLEFHGENFCGLLKNRKIRENFLPRKFPAIRYIVHEGWGQCTDLSTDGSRAAQIPWPHITASH